MENTDVENMTVISCNSSVKNEGSHEEFREHNQKAGQETSKARVDWIARCVQVRTAVPVLHVQ
jgi:hypothetical protein